jgi:hypothetical protein
MQSKAYKIRLTGVYQRMQKQLQIDCTLILQKECQNKINFGSSLYPALYIKSRVAVSCTDIR